MRAARQESGNVAMEAEDQDPFETTKKAISVAKNTPAVVTVPGTGGDLHDEDTLSPARIQAAAQAGRDLGKNGRVALMQTIGERFGIPHEGFSTGQSRIYDKDDIRFEQTLRVLSRTVSSRAAAANLKRAMELVPEVDSLLVLTTTAREYHPGLTSRGSEKVDSFRDGGLDFLDDVKNRLGLPKSIVGNWEHIPPYRSDETENLVHPSMIPVRDQILGYAALTRLSFKNFCTFVKSEEGEARGQALLDCLSRDARAVWQAYSFLCPVGSRFDPKEGPKHGQKFGVNSAFGYLRHLASTTRMPFDMNAILTTPALHHTDYVKIAKARALEAAFFQHLLEQAAVSTAEDTEH
jgi:hypothetical protein